jgi:hypothetical protein
MFTLEAITSELYEAIENYNILLEKVEMAKAIADNLWKRVESLENLSGGYEFNDWVYNRKVDDAYRAYDEATEEYNALYEAFENEETKIEALRKLRRCYKNK